MTTLSRRVLPRSPASAAPGARVWGAWALALASACGAPADGGGGGGGDGTTEGTGGGSGDSGSGASTSGSASGTASGTGGSTGSSGTGASTSAGSSATATGTSGDGSSTGPGGGSSGGVPDEDLDGIPDGSDNCPDVANSNQLDFDGNGTGNVCDATVFSTVSGALDTTLVGLGGPMGDCSKPLVLDVTGGLVIVRLDDAGQVVGVEIDVINVANEYGIGCALAIPVTLSLTDFSFLNSEVSPVSVPYDMTQHDAGAFAGLSDAPHPHASSGTLTADVDGLENPFEPAGTLPVFTLSVAQQGAGGTLMFNDAALTLGNGLFNYQQPFPFELDVSLVGLAGTLALAP